MRSGSTCKQKQVLNSGLDAEMANEKEWKDCDSMRKNNETNDADGRRIEPWRWSGSRFEDGVVSSGLAGLQKQDRQHASHKQATGH